MESSFQNYLDLFHFAFILDLACEKVLDWMKEPLKGWKKNWFLYLQSCSRGWARMLIKSFPHYHHPLIRSDHLNTPCASATFIHNKRLWKLSHNESADMCVPLMKSYVWQKQNVFKPSWEKRKLRCYLSGYCTIAGSICAKSCEIVDSAKGGRGKIRGNKTSGPPHTCMYVHICAYMGQFLQDGINVC